MVDEAERRIKHLVHVHQNLIPGPAGEAELKEAEDSILRHFSHASFYYDIAENEWKQMLEDVKTSINEMRAEKGVEPRDFERDMV